MKKSKIKIKQLKFDKPIQYIQDDDYIVKMGWKTLSQKKIDNLFQQLDKVIFNYDNKQSLKIVIGSDSQRRGSVVDYITTIILYANNIGRVFYLKQWKKIQNFYKMMTQAVNKQQQSKYIRSISRQRLWIQCMKSIRIAQMVDKFVAKYGLKVNQIHADINVNKKYLSNQLFQSIVGYIQGMNYKAVCKPDSWAASWVANVKTK